MLWIREMKKTGKRVQPITIVRRSWDQVINVIQQKAFVRFNAPAIQPMWTDMGVVRMTNYGMGDVVLEMEQKFKRWMVYLFVIPI
jgi:hypothetical protein